MLLEIASRQEELPALTPFFEHLQQREQQLLGQTQAYIKTFYLGKLKRKLKKARNSCRRRSKNADILPAVLDVIDSVYASAVFRRQAVDPLQLPTLHHLRIAVKKLRYLLLIAHPLLPGFPTELPKNMQNYLTLMGDIQNSAVLSQNLENFFGEGTPEGVQQYFQKQQQDLLREFMERKDELLSFWRASKEEGWPWEVQTGFSA